MSYPPACGSHLKALAATLSVKSAVTAAAFAANTHLVVDGRRTAYLVDGTAADQAAVARAAALVVGTHARTAPCVLAVFDQLFVVSSARLAARCAALQQRRVDSLPVWACDAAAGAPAWPDTLDALVEWQARLTADAQAILSAVDESHRGGARDSPSSSCVATAFVHSAAQTCPVALTGWLLEFPVVYDTRGANGSQHRRGGGDASAGEGNFLGGNELTLFTVTYGGLLHHPSALMGDAAHCSFAFSVPSALLGENRGDINTAAMMLPVTMPCCRLSRGLNVADNLLCGDTTRGPLVMSADSCCTVPPRDEDCVPPTDVTTAAAPVSVITATPPPLPPLLLSTATMSDMAWAVIDAWRSGIEGRGAAVACEVGVSASSKTTGCGSIGVVTVSTVVLPVVAL